MNDLRVENYDKKEVKAKKQSIAKRVTAVGGVAVLSLMGLFKLTGCPAPDPPIVVGGAGAWFYSYPEDEQTED